MVEPRENSRGERSEMTPCYNLDYFRSFILGLFRQLNRLNYYWIVLTDKVHMRTFLNLFGRSPFTPLQSHMQNVADCVHQLMDLFEALENKNFERVEKIANAISEHEHIADITKNDIRNHLPKSLFVPIDRSQLLEILGILDGIADRA